MNPYPVTLAITSLGGAAKPRSPVGGAWDQITMAGHPKCPLHSGSNDEDIMLFWLISLVFSCISVVRSAKMTAKTKGNPHDIVRNAIK